MLLNETKESENILCSSILALKEKQVLNFELWFLVYRF